jgi:hypothetical protein
MRKTERNPAHFTEPGCAKNLNEGVPSVASQPVSRPDIQSAASSGHSAHPAWAGNAPRHILRQQNLVNSVFEHVEAVVTREELENSHLGEE